MDAVNSEAPSDKFFKALADFRRPGCIIHELQWGVILEFQGKRLLLGILWDGTLRFDVPLG